VVLSLNDILLLLKPLVHRSTECLDIKLLCTLPNHLLVHLVELIDVSYEQISLSNYYTKSVFTDRVKAEV
jgi:hypothetical protein